MPTGRRAIAPRKEDDSIKTATEGGGLTAHSGGGQALATLLDYGANEISVVAVANDSVVLPVAVGGKDVYVANNTANSAQVFGQTATGDTINGVATGTGVALAAGKNAVFFCIQTSNAALGIAGRWRMVLSA